MINYLIKYFTLNRRERNGMMLLISLIFVLALAKYFIVYHYQPNTAKVTVVELDDIAAKLALQEMMSPEKKSYSPFPEKNKKDSLFYFDPNKITEQQAIQLGFSTRSAHTFINYRNKGAKFYKTEDLRKLYGMTDRLFDQLKSYVLIPPTGKETLYQKEEKSYNKKTFQKEKISFEINSADSTTWMKLKGIGPGYARRILKYKSLLGGFTAVDQIREVYNFPDSLYNSIKDNLTVDASLIQKLPVNTVDFKTMVHHPYIKYEGTKCIFALKRGKKIKAEDVINSSCFSRELLAKVLPYLDFE